MGDTFGNSTWHRPGEISRKDPQRGRNQRELQERASYDNEPQLGCGAILLLCILAAALGIALI